MSALSDELCGAPAVRSVERAIAELRGGRAVMLVDENEHRHVVVAAENLGKVARRLLRQETGARLLVTAARLRALGLANTDDQATALPMEPLPDEDFSRLVVGRESPETLPAGEPLQNSDHAALELIQAALLLPCAVVLPAVANAHDCLLRVTVSDIRQYRTDHQARPQIVARAPVPLEHIGPTEFVVFRGGEGLREQVAVVIGMPDPAGPVLMRIHSACLTGDLFGSLKCDCGDQLRGTAQRMAEMGGGVLLYLDQEGRGNGIANKIRAYAWQAEGYDTYDADQLLGFEADNRRFDFAAHMMKTLGFTSVRLMTNNPEKIAGLKVNGLRVEGTVRVPARHTHENVDYLATKRDRAGHLLASSLKVTG